MVSYLKFPAICFSLRITLSIFNTCFKIVSILEHNIYSLS